MRPSAVSPYSPLPAVLGLQTRDRRIHHQQLVHQLTGPLHEHRVALAAPASRPVAAPVTSRRLSRVQRTRCRGDAVSLIVTSGPASCFRIAAGTGSVIARYCSRALEVTPQRLELARRGAGAHDDGLSPHEAPVDDDLHLLGARTNLCDARSLEEGPATRPCRGRQAQAGAIGVERERRAEPNAAGRIEGRRLSHVRRQDPLRVQSGRLARLVLTPQHLSIVARCDLDVVAGFQSALDAEPPDESGRIEGRPPPAFEDAPRRAKTVALGDIPE